MNLLTGKRLPRRTVLRGVGAAVGLPALEAMLPAAAGAQAAKPPLRLCFVYVPNGIILQEWLPAENADRPGLPRILRPLEKHRDVVTLISGLDDRNGNALGDGPGDHARAGASFLTGVHCRKTAGADIQGGISADQVAAMSVGRATRLPSLELGCEDSRTVGNCDSGYSCAYTNSISWRTPATPMPPETNPRQAFERLFGSADSPPDPEARARRARNRRSILDLVQEDARRLLLDLGPGDRRKVDAYLTAVREVERTIQAAERTAETPADLERPTGIPIRFTDYIRLMYDLLVLAYRTDATRVSTLMVGREGSLRVYPEIGIPDPHHPLTHHRNNPEWVEKIIRINTLHVEMLAYFLDRLQAIREADGTLLDRCMIVYGSGLADGNAHTHEDLPILLAGRGGGSLHPGGRLVCPPGTPLTNLYLSLLDRMGVRPDRIGDSTGKLTLLAGL